MIDSSVESQPIILVSAGKIGAQIELSPEELRKAVPFTVAPLTRTDG